MTFEAGQKSRKIIPKRRVQGGLLFILIAVVAYFATPRPNIKIVNLSGQTVEVSLKTNDHKLQHQLKNLRTWRITETVEMQNLVVVVQFPEGKTVHSTFKNTIYPLNLSVAANGSIKTIE